MNPENLTPFNQMDSERQREVARMGGIASGVTRRRRAYMRKMFQYLLKARSEARANSERTPRPPVKKNRV